MWARNKMLGILLLLCTVSNALQIVDLNGSNWKVNNANGTVSAPATVPGAVHTDLFAAKVIGNPFYRFGDTDYRWIALDDWTFSRSFSVDSSFVSLPRQELVCEGLDTIATVYINGAAISKADNMFRRYIIDVTGKLRAGTNTITVVFRSAVTVGKEKCAAYPYKVPSTDGAVQHGELNRHFLRKEQCSFSWDWGPGFIPQGIWRPIKLVGYPEVYITDVVPLITPASRVPLAKDSPYQVPNSWNVKVTVHMRVAGAGVSGTLTAGVQGLTGQTALSPTSGPGPVTLTTGFSVSGVEPWWPNGMGSQQMYDLVVNFKGSRGEAIQVTKRVGFRSIELITTPLPDGQAGAGNAMYIKVNGVPVFMRGSNWIPASPFPNSLSDEDLRRLLVSAQAANMNGLRVWGGGIYQPDIFYDLADQLGLLIWEDVMFACAMYPRDGDFLANVAEEVRYQVRRLASHPSLMMWSANNENEGALWWYPESTSNRDLYLADYVKLYVDVVRPAIMSEDNTRPFWPSSPSNGPLVDTDTLYGPPTAPALVQTVNSCLTLNAVKRTAIEAYLAVLSLPCPHRVHGMVAMMIPVLRWGNVQSPSYGDVHYYSYDGKCTDWTTFPKPRFASEYGWQSYPSYAVLAPDLDPAQGDLAYNSPLLEHRQHHPDGTAQIVKQMALHTCVPAAAGAALDRHGKNVAGSQRGLENFIYLSQAVQTMCIQAQTEHYRRGRDTKAYTMGAVYWQLNDIWAGQSWSSLDIGAHWKPLHYAAKRFFEPVHVSAYEDGILPSLHVHLANEDPTRAWVGDLNVELWSWNGSKMVSRVTQSNVVVPPNSGKEIYSQVVELILPRGVKRADVAVVLDAIPRLASFPARSTNTT
ncbi:putative Beta-mannosidase A [Paratrimastix pyriformis]|uniref:Beta-mannosidase B n=1 Tax=Paratrimastix pyriformis TaxID=342808 RepID=A0ABQ8UMB1_9EUKA|nr:putative Beta-mannosidase A [Paratrimastix pyriformis]